MAADEQKPEKKLDPNLRYWKAAIDSLQSPEKRDAAWEFYSKKFSDPKAADFIGGLVLLLEANTTYLLNLPQAFNSQVIVPLEERMAAFRLIFASFEAIQNRSIVALDNAAQISQRVNELHASTAREMQSSVKRAFEQIDIQEIGSRINETVRHSILEPYQKSAENFSKGIERLKEATLEAKTALSACRSFHWKWSILVCLIIALVVTGCVFGFSWSALEKNAAIREAERQEAFTQKIATEVAHLKNNQSVVHELALMGVTIHLRQAATENGDAIAGMKALVVMNAEGAGEMKREGKKDGMIFVKDSRPTGQYEAIQRLAELQAQASPTPSPASKEKRK